MRSTTRKRPLIGAAAVLLIAATTACTGGSDPAPSPTLEPAPSGAPSDSGGESTSPEGGDEPVAGECDAKEGDDSLPSEAPAVDAWAPLGSTAVPTSETYGPYVQDGDLWTCYEHSPVGALLATNYVWAAMGNVQGFAETWIEPGEFQDAVLEQEQSTESPEMSGTTTLAGYRYVSYTPDAAVIDVAVEYSNADGTAHLAMRLAVKWEEDRWMVDPESLGSDYTPLESLDGYVRWGTDG